MVRRAELHGVLADAVGAHGVEVQFGRKLVAIDRTDPWAQPYA
jgi:hypothetical protein